MFGLILFFYVTTVVPTLINKKKMWTKTRVDIQRDMSLPGLYIKLKEVLRTGLSKKVWL